MQRLCIFSKKVHASERKWSRLVIPGAQVPFFVAMQGELRTSGDFQLWVTGSGGSAQAWRWGCRMSVQRPMILELSQFYDDNAVCTGDTVSVYRDLRTSVLTVEVERVAEAEQAAAALAAATAAVTPAARAAALAAAMPASKGASACAGAAPAPAAAFPAGHLPAARWHFKAGGSLQQGGGGSGRQRSPAHSEGEDDDGGMDYPFATSCSRGAASRGPLAVRRRLQQLQGLSHDTDCSDEDSSDVYTASQTRRFDALVDAAACLSQSPPA